MMFEYKVRARHKLGWKEFKLYADTDIEEFFNRKSIEYVRNMIDTIENKQQQEIERLNNILIELVKWLHSEIKRLDKMQDTYDKHGKKKDPNIIYISGAYIEVLDKLQELTGE